jgi:hypothetical protein
MAPAATPPQKNGQPQPNPAFAGLDIDNAVAPMTADATRVVSIFLMASPHPGFVYRPSNVPRRFPFIRERLLNNYARILVIIIGGWRLAATPAGQSATRLVGGAASPLSCFAR